MKKLIAILILCVASVASGIVVENGDTSVITYFVFRDKTAGTVDTGVNIANIDAYYIEEGAVISAKTDLQAHAAGDDAWDATLQGYHMGFGVYRIDWPNAAFDGGIHTRVQLIVIDGDGGAFTEIMEVELSPPVDTVAISGDGTAADNLELMHDGTKVAVESVFNNAASKTAIATEIFDDPNWTGLVTNVDDIELDTAAMDDAAGMKILVWGSTAIDLTGDPGDDATLFEMLHWLYKLSRNKLTQTESECQVYNVNGIKISEATISDSGPLYTREEYRAVD